MNHSPRHDQDNRPAKLGRIVRFGAVSPTGFTPSISTVVVAVVAVVVMSLACACQRGAGVEMAAAQPAENSAEQLSATSDGESTAGANFTVFHPALSMGTDAPGRLELRVTPQGGFKVNTEYPWLLTITPPDSLTVEQRQWDVSAAELLTEDEALFAIPVSASAAGQLEVEGHLRFSVCNDARCDTPQARVVWSVTVE